jgi:hypothetical protein
MAYISRACLFAVAAASLAFVASGVPLLRHDWFPIIPSMRFAVDDVTGWNPVGLGSVVGYPASFLFVFARSAVATVAGAYAAHILYFGGFALLLVFGASRLVAVLGGNAVARVAAALFAAFNPWMYTELVAGHGFTLVSYGATFWLLAECCDRNPSRLRLVLLALVVAPQIQFLLIAIVAYVWLSFRMRSWLLLSAIAAVTLPVVVGIFVSRKALLGIPLTLEWERGQSVDPLRGVFLRGYFTGYDTVLPNFFEWAQWAIVGIACLGVIAILVWHRRRAWLVVLCTIPLLWSGGLEGPLRGVFVSAIEHVPEAGLFRELYGLLGFVAIGYVAFCALATTRIRFVSEVWLFAGLTMLVAWIVAPPGRYWVRTSELPPTAFGAAPDSRVLLTPALYPIRFEDRGSGVDPDLYARDGNVAPVNEAFPLYPVSAAIGSFLRDGTTQRLAALGVSNIIARPWLQTDPSIRFQLALPAPPWLLKRTLEPSSIDDAVPQLSLGPLPQVGTLASNFGAGNVLFGDARDVAGSGVPASWRAFAPITIVSPGNRFVDASTGWVDARLAFLEAPELAQPYGGALTTNDTSELSVTPSEFALVFVHGSLLAANGSTLATTERGYRWISVPQGVASVRCRGLCVVAAESEHVPSAPLDPPTNPQEAVAFQTPVPWLVTATLPSGSSHLLRYGVTYDDAWTAYFDGGMLPHVRIDGVVNGWIVPPRNRSTQIVLVERGAALTTLSEILSALAFAIVLTYALRGRETVRAFQIDATAKSDKMM